MYEVKKSYICQQVPSSLSGIYEPAVLSNLFAGELPTTMEQLFMVQTPTTLFFSMANKVG